MDVDGYTICSACDPEDSDELKALIRRSFFVSTVYLCPLKGTPGLHTCFFNMDILLTECQLVKLNLILKILLHA